MLSFFKKLKYKTCYLIALTAITACSSDKESKTIESKNAPLIEKTDYVSTSSSKGEMALSASGKSTALLINSSDFPGVIMALKNLQSDIEKVTNAAPEIIYDKIPERPTIVLVGTIGQSPVIDRLIKEKRINVSEIKGKWEAFMHETVSNPFPGVEKALVIAGSDKRGTIYGIYDLSRAIGVSPWYWWADVPVRKHEALYVTPGRYVTDSPKVKYRGIFLNDEEPALGSWAREKFGGFNHQFYRKVFELVLRMRGNYMWPAMWGSAFYDDDTENGKLANKMGIVMGTSHHEPLAKAHKEWKMYGKGAWNFNTNAPNLKKFWESGMERAKNWESVITIGMRGDGDEAMTEGTAIHLLETIVDNQRKIIAKTTGKPANETPQMWALYKEVQEYYDKGMKIPDDITLLFCDDNWGNLRKLPELDAPPRKGGYGIYYHFDYVGGPRSYRWINTNQIERTWEQMNMAYEHGVNNIWIVNVGDLKPMELPISFWFDMAWNPEKFNAANLQNYYSEWAKEQFNGQYTTEIADLLQKYTKFNARIKPELLDANTFSLKNYNEWHKVYTDYKKLEKQSKKIEKKIAKKHYNAYYQLIAHPIEASSNLYAMYYNTAQNHYYAKQKNSRANLYAEKVAEYFKQDSAITAKYHALNNGKWNHFMDQTHIGYTCWDNPPKQVMPKVETISVPKAKSSEKINFRVPQKPATPEKAKGFIENNGYISIEAIHFSSKTEPDNFKWSVVKNLGKTEGAVISLPIKKGRVALTEESPKLSYPVCFKNKGKVQVHCYFSPSINYSSRKGLYYGLSFDNEKATKINYDNSPDLFNYNGRVTEDWHRNVWNSIKIVTTEFEIDKAGNHTLNYFRVDEGLALQKIVIETQALPESFLGPPESVKK